jgi:hypothetical protein
MLNQIPGFINNGCNFRWKVDIEYDFESWLPQYGTSNVGFNLVHMNKGRRPKGFKLCVLDRWFEPRSGQTKDYAIGMCYFCDKYATLRNKIKDWLARNQNNVSKWSDMSNRGLLFQWVTSKHIQLSVLI